jgi:hypothetical protein
MIASRLLVTPRIAGARFASTAVGRSSVPVATAVNTNAAATAAASPKATITTTASSPSNPAPTASAAHARFVQARDGRLKSANRHFHANASESSPGLSQQSDSELMAQRRTASKLMRMREAKELAGLV